MYENINHHDYNMKELGDLIPQSQEERVLKIFFYKEGLISEVSASLYTQ